MNNKQWNSQIKLSLNIKERRCFTMQNNNYQTKHPRGISPPLQEMERGLIDWISRLPSIKPLPTCTQREEKAVAEAIPELVLQTANEGRWLDDGGKGG
jgi:hypothetical protein